MVIKPISFLLLLLCVTFTQQKFYQCDSNAPCGCSSYSAWVTARIVNGETAGDDTWSWAANLKIDNSLCGGSIISDSYIITAGHCVKNKRASQITAYVGSTILLQGQAQSISRIYLHPRYTEDPLNRYILHDIALLKLSTRLKLSDEKLAQVCLPRNNVALPSGTDLIAIGWGTKFEGSSSVSETLQQVTLNLINSTSSWCANITVDSASQFCAGIMPLGGKDTCQGDSGGPVMFFNNRNQWEIQGIVSYGDGCARPLRPGVNARVDYYLDWINQIVENDPSPNTASTLLRMRNSVRLIVFLSYFIIFILLH